MSEEITLEEQALSKIMLALTFWWEKKIDSHHSMEEIENIILSYEEQQESK